jgi:Domain of unknown function (DUF1833)
MTLTPAQKEAFARANSSQIVLWNLELRHPVFPSPIRVTQSFDGNKTLTIDFELEANAPIDSGTVQPFSALALRLDPPKSGTDPDSNISIQADGVSGVIQPLISEANRSYTPIQATIRAYSYNVSTSVVGDQLAAINLDMQKSSNTGTAVSMSFGYTNGANSTFPSIKYTAESNPGLL